MKTCTLCPPSCKATSCSGCNASWSLASEDIKAKIMYIRAAAISPLSENVLNHWTKQDI